MERHYRYTAFGLILAILTLTVATGEETQPARVAIGDSEAQSDGAVVASVLSVADQLHSDASAEESAGTDAESASHLIQDEVAPAPVGPQLFETAPTSPMTAQQLSASLFGGVGAAESLLSANRRSVAEGPATGVVLGSESKVLVTTDVGSLLRKSSSVLGVTAQRRSPIMNAPRIRGNSLGQLVASGSYWFPARPDLDTLVSKIDSHLIQDVVVIKGPYAARYGPGFSFIDFELAGTPRYEYGPAVEASTTLDYSSNGDQWYGRQSVQGGSQDYGYRIGYGHGVGIDYETGNGGRIPSSYNTRNFDAAFGFDLDPESSLEFVYLRQEQSGVELPNNVYDLRFLETDAFEVEYTKRDGIISDLFTLEGWYNQTRFDGNNLGPGKRAHMPLLNAINWTGNVQAQNMSTGFTSALTWGQADGCHLTLGTDLRYLKQNIDQIERADAFGAAAGNPLENYPVPRARSVNPGLFLNWKKHASSRLTLNGGARVDWVRTDAASTAPLAFTSQPWYSTMEEWFEVGSLDREFAMVSFYLTGEYIVDDNVTATFGGGYAERPPTLFQQYSVSPNANIMAQYATSFVYGHPDLKKERRWQVDAGVTAEYDRFRTGVSSYFAWVQDYITLDYFWMNAAAGIPLYGLVNTELATLVGTEVYAEYDVTPYATLFGNMSYVAGHDHSLNNTTHFDFFGSALTDSRDTFEDQALPMISPLESRLGFRLQEPIEASYGMEFSARIIARQDRVASLLLEQSTPAFATMDIRGFWRPTDRSTFVAGIENLADRHYQEHLDPRHHAIVFQPGINFYTGFERTY